MEPLQEGRAYLRQAYWRNSKNDNKLAASFIERHLVLLKPDSYCEGLHQITADSHHVQWNWSQGDLGSLLPILRRSPQVRCKYIARREYFAE